MAADIEAELKFTLRPGEAERLRASPAPDGFSAGPAETVHLVTTYFDTPGQALREAGISLRLRRVGEAGEQTVKLSGRPIGALAERREVTVPTSGDHPDLRSFDDPALVALLEDHIGGSALQPLFEMRVSRNLRLLTTALGDSVEYAIDEGEVTAGDRRADVVEAEFELKSGDPRSLFLAARQAMAALPVRFSAHPKSEIGYRLLDGKPLVAKPVKAAEPAIGDDASVEAAFRDILRSCFAQIAANAAAVAATDDPEGPHQLRVGLRRLRSALSLFKPVIDSPAATRLADETRWLAAEVGALRDLDVLIEEIVGPCGKRIDATALADVLGARRAAVRGALLGTLAGPRVGAYLIDLAAFIEGRGWLSFSDVGQSAALAARATDFAEEAVRRQWSKVARKGRDVGALTGEARHDLRKAFKKLRYGFDFFGSAIAGRDRRKAIKDVKAAQEVLGYLNDVLMAERMAEMVRSTAEYRASRSKADIERAIGYCLGWHQAGADRTWAEAKNLVSLDPDEI